MPTVIEKIGVFVRLVELSSGAFVEILSVVSAADIGVGIGDVGIGAVGFTDGTVDIDVGFFGGR